MQINKYFLCPVDKLNFNSMLTFLFEECMIMNYLTGGTDSLQVRRKCLITAPKIGYRTTPWTETYKVSGNRNRKRRREESMKS